MNIQSVGNAVVSEPASQPRELPPATPAARPAAPIETTMAVPAPSSAQVAQAIQHINKALQEQSRNLEFSIDADSQRTIVKVVDQKTGEVLRQIPTEEALEIAKALDQASGLLIRQQA